MDNTDNTYEKTCDDCGNTTRTIKAGISKRTGKPYTAFEVCDKCNPPKPRQGQQGNSQQNNTLLMEEIQGLHKRLDSMGKFMHEEFKKLNEK